MKSWPFKLWLWINQIGGSTHSLDQDSQKVASPHPSAGQVPSSPSATPLPCPGVINTRLTVPPN